MLSWGNLSTDILATRHVEIIRQISTRRPAKLPAERFKQNSPVEHVSDKSKAYTKGGDGMLQRVKF